MHVHLIGIGGIGISALARHYLAEGWQVSGSDVTKSDNTEKLETAGITIVYEQTANNITDGIDLVVYSDGVTSETVGWRELEAAREAGIETISYFEALARVANEYYLIAVAGTHGKTTTTAMLADILEEASYDPTVFVGSLRSKTGTNYRRGNSKYCIVEADEYLRHFLYFTPDVLVINNIDLDHPDYFADLADVQSAFTDLVQRVGEDGFIVADTKHSHVQPVLQESKATVIDYAQEFNITRSLLQPGVHNRQNAAAAESVAKTIGVEQNFIDTALQNFAGTARRFEYKGMVHNALVYDDYAHNPQKVAAAIAGTREMYPNKNLIVVFQPHTYSRTKTLRQEFVESLTQADQVILLPIYGAREIDDGTISSEMLCDDLKEKEVTASHFHTLEAAVLEIKNMVGGDDVVLCVGAGTVTQVARELTI